MFWRKHKKQQIDTGQTSLCELKAIALTDMGSVRNNNEDNVIFIRPSDSNIRETKGYLGIVADGMGGHNAGEIASQLAVNSISKQYYELKKGPLDCLEQAFWHTNNLIHARASSNSDMSNMGTTCTAVAVIGSQMIIGHIGDSRAYLHRDGQLIQLTSDHTLVQELVDSGKLDPLAAMNHPQRNMLTKALGTSKNRQSDVFMVQVDFNHRDDRILLCSDGLYEYFSHEELNETISKNDIRTAGEHLIEMAKIRGGHDNISLILIEGQSEDMTSAHPTTFQKEIS